MSEITDEAEIVAQWLVFIGDRLHDLPPVVEAAQVMRDLRTHTVTLEARIAAALDALRTAPDLDTAEPSKATLRRAHTAILAAWAELAGEPASVRPPVAHPQETP